MHRRYAPGAEPSLTVGNRDVRSEQVRGAKETCLLDWSRPAAFDQSVLEQVHMVSDLGGPGSVVATFADPAELGISVHANTARTAPTSGLADAAARGHGKGHFRSGSRFARWSSRYPVDARSAWRGKVKRRRGGGLRHLGEVGLHPVKVGEQQPHREDPAHVNVPHGGWLEFGR